MDNPAFTVDLDEENQKNGNKTDEQLEQTHSFEEAVTLTGVGKYHYFLLLATGLCFMLVMIETMGVSIILPYLKCDLASTIAEQGFLSSSGFLGIVLSSHLMGFLADTRGRVKTLRGALFFGFITSVISAFSVNIQMLIAFRFLNGFCLSGCQACVFSLVGEFHGNRTRVKYVTMLSMFLPVAMIAIPGLAMGILPLQLDVTALGMKLTSWRLLLLLNSSISLFAFVGMLLSCESPKYELIQGNHEAAIKTLRVVFRMNTGRQESEYPVKRIIMQTSGANLSNVHSIGDALSLVWSQTVPLFYKERVLQTINICCIMFVVYGASQGLFMWFPTMLDQLVVKDGQGYTVCAIMTELGSVSTNSTVDADSCTVPVKTDMFVVMICIGAVFTGIFLVFTFTIEIIGKKNLLKNQKNGNKTDEQLEQTHSFEEAVTLTGVGKYHYFLLLATGLCFMLVMIETMGVSIILPYLKCDLASTIAEQGFLSSSGFLGIVLSSHLMGFLADTRGRVKTLRGALFFGFITSVISAFSVNIQMLIAFRFLNGFCLSGCQACVFSLVGEFHGNRTRVKYVTMLSMFLPVAMIAIPGLAMGILPLQLDVTALGMKLTSWRLLLLLNSSISLFAFVGMLLSCESPKYELIQGNHEAAIKTLRVVFRMNTGRQESEYPVKRIIMQTSGANLSNVHSIGDALSLVWSQTVPLFYKERVLQTINICCIMFVVYGASQGLFMWFPTMLDQLVVKDGQGYTVCAIMTELGSVSTNSTVDADSCTVPVKTDMFVVMICIGAVFTGIFLVFTFTIEIIGKKNLLIGWLVIAIACCLLIHWTTSFPLIIVLITLIMGTGSCGAIVSTISVEYFPTNINAMAMCLILMIGRLGAVVGSNIVGLTIFTYCDILFYVYVAALVLVAISSVFLPNINLKSKANKPTAPTDNANTYVKTLEP